MVINLTELPWTNWSDAQILAAKKLATDGVLREYELPTVLPSDSHSYVWCAAYDARNDIESKNSDIDAIIVQGEPNFVYNFVTACYRRLPIIPCYSPCYDSNGNFVQFRKF